MIRTITRLWVLGFTVCVAPAPLAYGQTSRAHQPPVSMLAAASQGELHGTIRDQRGDPLAGVMISASARGAAPVFAMSDRTGRYVFRQLAPGAYLVRAYLAGYSSPRGGYVEVSPGGRRAWPIALNRLDSTEAPILEAGVGAVGTTGAAPARPAPPPEDDEFAWHMRQIRRGILKEATNAAAAGGRLDTPDDGTTSWYPSLRSSGNQGSLLGSVSGQINLLTTASFDRPQDLFERNAGAPRPIAYVSLVAPVWNGEWSVRGSATEGDIASWILAGSFTTARDDAAHNYEVGLTYAAQRYQGGNPEALAAMRDGSRNVGEIYAYDNWVVTPQLTITAGGRYASYDYLADRFLLGGRFGVSYQVSPDDPLRLRVTAVHRELAPGAEEFVAPDGGIWLPPERTFSAVRRGAELRPEKVNVVEIGGERPVGGDIVVGLRAFRQQVDDQLVTLFATRNRSGAASPGHYRVASAGDFENYGWGVTVAGRVAEGTQASIDYTMTETHRRDVSDDRFHLFFIAPGVLRREERVHDLTASVNGRLDASATRFLMVYKLNNAYASAASRRPHTAGRFEVQVNQEMPFLDITGASWEMLVSVRDLFRSEMFDGSVYDELFVVRPPKRVTAGVKVLF